VVVFRDLAKVELFEAGRLLDAAAHTEDLASRRRIERLSVAFYVGFDFMAVGLAVFASFKLLRIPLDAGLLRIAAPVCTLSAFVCLVFFRTYVTVWARAMVNNYLRLLCACIFGSLFAAVALYYSPASQRLQLPYFPALFAFLAFVLLLGVRFVRPVVREIFFELGCIRLRSGKGAVRILVYGSGLRYRAFRRELVRSLATGERIVVGLVDDDALLLGKYIGNVKVLGGIRRIPELVKEAKADAIVVACRLSAEKDRLLRELAAEAGVAVSNFEIGENNRADDLKNGIL
jgi:FlaA1/EpsC-like NDP-sugar epimerase